MRASAVVLVGIGGPVGQGVVHAELGSERRATNQSGIKISVVTAMRLTAEEPRRGVCRHVFFMLAAFGSVGALVHIVAVVEIHMSNLPCVAVPTNVVFGKRNRT